MNRVKFSIIVPIYNSAETIEACVESIIAQKEIDWELILADNGSTDNSQEIINRLSASDARIKAISVPRRGVSFARNAALDIAIGEYIAFVDSDDTIEADYLSNLNTGADLSICGYQVDYYNSDHGITRCDLHVAKAVTWHIGESKQNLQEPFEKGFFHLCCNKLYKRSIIEQNCIRFQEFPVNEDHIFILSFLKYAESITIVEKPLYHWIRIEGKTTGVNSLPDNLLSIYNQSHLLTREFFKDNSIADRIAYISYEMIIYKYYDIHKKGALAKSGLYRILCEFVSNPLVKEAYKSYSPKTKGEATLYYLMKSGLYKLHYIVYHKLLNGR